MAFSVPTIERPLVTQAAALFGMPTTSAPGGAFQPNVLAVTNYYGDTPPSYYSASDRDAVAAVTAQWGGGVPRYALIVARYAQYVMERSGAEQVNFVSASFGSLITRWLIEKDLCGLASSGKIARWMSAEGVLCGNWAASHGDLVDLWGRLGASTLDIHQMDYSWVETNLHAPRRQADSPYYGQILIGEIGSTNDVSGGEALSDFMLASNDFMPNDGTQALPDAVFEEVTSRSRLLGLPPTLSTYHVDHLALADERVAWLQVAAFLVQRRRVTVTLTQTQVTDVHEPHAWYWNWMPAEVVFETKVFSPLAAERWGIDAPLSELGEAGAAAPLRRFDTQGATERIDQLVYDGFVFDAEQDLRIDLAAKEIDYDIRYGVAETVQQPFDDDLGSTSVRVSVRTPGTYNIHTPSWNGTLEVRVTDYPFALPTDAIPFDTPPWALHLEPNPFSNELHITIPAARAHSASNARLEIYDVRGRLVRTLEAPLGAGFKEASLGAGLTWDGLDAHHRALPAGLYLHKLTVGSHVFVGKAVLVR
jgi:hypothetical protein